MKDKKGCGSCKRSIFTFVGGLELCISAFRAGTHVFRQDVHKCKGMTYLKPNQMNQTAMAASRSTAIDIRQ